MLFCIVLSMMCAASVALPRSQGHPIFMDIALSQVAKLKVVQYQKEGRPVPDGWVVDGEGLPTNAPQGNDFSMCPMSAAFRLEFQRRIGSEGHGAGKGVGKRRDHPPIAILLLGRDSFYIYV